MSIFQESVAHQEVVSKYFSDPEKCIVLKKNEVLIAQGELNRKLYYVKSGKLSGFLPDEYLAEPILEAQAGSFLGVYSYFSEDHKSYSQVVANEKSEVYYLDDDPKSLTHPDKLDLLGFLFNVVVLELRSRQHFAARMANDRQEAMNKLIQTEKLITLGQLSAGLAHELNNTIGSLSSNLGQIEKFIDQLIVSTQNQEQHRIFQKGLSEGLTLSSKEERELRKSWSGQSKWDTAQIKKLIRAGISSAAAKNPKDAIHLANLWNAGQVLHDMKIASKQASHVVSSIKTMGIANQQWSPNVQINETIKEAIVILKSITKYAEVNMNLDEALPTMEACHGELVQVWVNLIKNAIENLRHHQVSNPSIQITSLATKKHLQISIADNGTGIDESIMSRIYEPSFTTKVEGLSLGLGLGLTIVQRIISEHEGKIKIESKPGSTVFKIRFRKRSSHG